MRRSARQNHSPKTILTAQRTINTIGPEPTNDTPTSHTAAQSPESLTSSGTDTAEIPTWTSTVMEQWAKLGHTVTSVEWQRQRKEWPVARLVEQIPVGQ